MAMKIRLARGGSKKRPHLLDRRRRQPRRPRRPLHREARHLRPAAAQGQRGPGKDRPRARPVLARPGRTGHRPRRPLPRGRRRREQEGPQQPQGRPAGQGRPRARQGPRRKGRRPRRRGLGRISRPLAMARADRRRRRGVREGVRAFSHGSAGKLARGDRFAAHRRRHRGNRPSLRRLRHRHRRCPRRARPGGFPAAVRRADDAPATPGPVGPRLDRLSSVRDKPAWGMAFRRGLFPVAKGFAVIAAALTGGRHERPPRLRRRHRRRLRRPRRGAPQVLLRRYRRNRRLRPARHRGRPQLRRQAPAPHLRRLRRAAHRRLDTGGSRGSQGHPALRAARPAAVAAGGRVLPRRPDRTCRLRRRRRAHRTVQAVQNHGAGDILEIARPGAAEVLLPFTRAAVPTVDVAAGRIVADPPEGLLDPAPGE